LKSEWHSEGQLGRRFYSAIDIKTIMALVITVVVAMYLIAYTFPTPASVISNSTGLWCPGEGARCSSITGIFQLAAVVLPLVLLVIIALYFVKHAK